MNDGLASISTDTDNGADFGLDAEVAGNSSTDSGTESDFDTSGDSVSDALGDSSLLPSDTTDSAETPTPSENTDSENSTENTESVETEEMTDSQPSSFDGEYLPELEYIDFLLNTQIEEMNAVQTVSGNSIHVTFDDTINQTLQEMNTSQLAALENQSAIINLLSCVLLAVVIDFLIASARRTAKKMHGRKE